VHFLVQSVPTNCVDEIVRVIKSITAKELFKRHPEVKKQLWEEIFGSAVIMQIQ
jgi:putative transposase